MRLEAACGLCYGSSAFGMRAGRRGENKRPLVRFRRQERHESVGRHFMIMETAELRSIGVATTSRADYGIYRPLLDAIQNDPELQSALARIWDASFARIRSYREGD